MSKWWIGTDPLDTPDTFGHMAEIDARVAAFNAAYCYPPRPLTEKDAAYWDEPWVTIDVGYVHVLTEPGGPCEDTCPHPDHSTPMKEST